MDEFLSDEEQGERAKQWLRENLLFIVAGVVLGLGGLYGWQEWQVFTANKAGDASELFDQLNAAVVGNYNRRPTLQRPGPARCNGMQFSRRQGSSGCEEGTGADL